MQARAVLPTLLLTLLVPTAAGADSLTDLLADLEGVRQATNVPAYGFALVDTTSVLYADAHGTADLASGAEARTDSRFRIGSITKTFTALALLLAAERGLLSLDDPFATIAGPGLIDNPFASHTPVRLVHLLEHSAGLGDLNHEEMYHSDPTPLALATAVRRYRANRRVQWRPGEYYSYTNAGAGLAAFALELASGRSYEHFLADELFAPLGMAESSVLLDEATAAHLVRGYDSDALTPIPYWHMLFRPFGAINASVGDMATFVRFLLNAGRVDDQQVLSAASIARMERVESTRAARAGLANGYGPGLYAWYNGGYRFFGHGGDGDGYLAHFGYSRAAGLGYFVVINAFDHRALRGMRERIETHILATLPAPTPAAAAPPNATPPAMLGPYRRATDRFGAVRSSHPQALRLLKRGHDLIRIDADGGEQRLVSAGERLWRRPDEPAASAAIVTNAVGEWVYLGMRESYIRIPDASPAAAPSAQP